MSELTPRVEPLTLPSEYGRVRKTLRWPDVSGRLTTAMHYWLATVRGDGRPHTVPVDALWEADFLWFGGSTATVHHANLLRGGRVAVHTEDAMAPVIVEGLAELITASAEHGEVLAAGSRAKYGYGDSAAYRSPVWRVTPKRVLAWKEFPADATRFVFSD